MKQAHATLFAFLLLSAGLTAVVVNPPGVPIPAAGAAEAGEYPVLPPEPGTVEGPPKGGHYPTSYPTSAITGDSWVSSAAPTTKYGNDARLRLANAPGNTREALVAVDIGPRHPSMFVRSAFLRLNDEEAYSCPAQLSIGRITSAWDPATVTWNTRPSVTIVKTASSTGAPKGGGQGIVAPNCGEYAGAEGLDVTNVFRQWVTTDAPIYGIHLGVGANADRTYHSQNSASTTLRPQLIVEWGWKPNAPTSVSAGPGSRGEVSTETPTIVVKLPDSSAPSSAPPSPSTVLQARVSIYRPGSTGPPLWTKDTAPKPPGSTVSVQVPTNTVTNGSQYAVRVKTVDPSGSTSDLDLTGGFKVDVYTAVTPAPPCAGDCVPTANPITQTFTLPANTRTIATFAIPELSGLDHVGTAWLNVTTPAFNSDTGLKIYPEDATEPAYPTLAYSATQTTRSVMVPTTSDTSTLTFVNTYPYPVTFSATLTAATNGYTDQEKRADALAEGLDLSADQVEAVAAGSTAGVTLADTTGQEPAAVSSKTPTFTTQAAGTQSCQTKATQAYNAGTDSYLCTYQRPMSQLRAEAAQQTPAGAEQTAVLDRVQESAGSVCRERVDRGWVATGRFHGCAAAAYTAEIYVLGQRFAWKDYVVMMRMGTHATNLDTDGKVHVISGRGDANGQWRKFIYSMNMGCYAGHAINCNTSTATSTSNRFTENGTNGLIHRIYATSLPVGAVVPFWFRMNVGFDYPGMSVPAERIDDPEGKFGGIRCDSYFRWPGCVFPNFRPEFQISLSHPVHPKAAKHIRDAHDEGHVRLVHREADKSRQRKNARKAKAMCRERYGNSKDWAGQCDEYPFKSTKEGCFYAGGGCSVRLIPATDNESAGGALGSWIQAQRVWDGEAYTVKVVP